MGVPVRERKHGEEAGRCDREDPRPQMPSVLQPVVRAECSQERLLPGILGSLSEQPPQVAQHLVAVGEVETLERRDPVGHDFHHLLKRSTAPECETCRTACKEPPYSEMISS